MFVAGKTCVACVELLRRQRKLAPAIRQIPAGACPVRSHVFFPRVCGSPLGIATLNSNTRISSMSHEMALVAYRNLLRSARIAFHGRQIHTFLTNRIRYPANLTPGDANVLSAARVEVRRNFESNRHLQTGSEEMQKEIARANEVAKFLRENVVQGEATEGDNYSMHTIWWTQ
jgi:complex III assembly factor LYRM7